MDADSVILSTASGLPAVLASPDASHTLILQTSGEMRIVTQPGNVSVFRAGPFLACKAPFRLLLLRSGALVLRDKNNITIWSSMSACSGNNSSCHSAAVLNDGLLVGRDGLGRTTWSSIQGGSGGETSGQQLRQFISGGSAKVGLGCSAAWGQLHL